MIKIIDQKRIMTPDSLRDIAVVELEIADEKFVCVTATFPGRGGVTVELKQIIPTNSNKISNISSDSENVS